MIKRGPTPAAMAGEILRLDETGRQAGREAGRETGRDAEAGRSIEGGGKQKCSKKPGQRHSYVG